MNFLRKAIIIGIAPIFLSFSAIAEVKVVTTIKPVHSLVSGVMDGVSNPTLIIEGSNNPHNFSLKPSHAKMLEEADIVFWIGEDLESFMEKPLSSLAKDAVKISFMDLPSIKKLKFREKNIFDDGHDDHDGHEDEHEGHDDHDHDGHKDDDHDDHGHDDHDGHEDEHEGHDDHDHDGHKDDDHDDHGHDDHDGHEDEHEGHDDHDHDGHKDDDHDDHGHDDHDGHEDEHEGHDDHDHDGHKDDDHDDHGHDDHDGHEDEHEGHDDHHGHHHGEFDAHIWLDPSNAIEMVLEISHELSEIDPDNAAKYEQNADKMVASLKNLISEVDSTISKDASFVVFHDAYQYFENRFGVSSAGALTLNPDVLPGAKQIDAIQDLIQDDNIKCIFSEPQYNPKIIETLAADMNISTGVMDPLGAFIDQGPEMYNQLILNIANSLKDCS